MTGPAQFTADHAVDRYQARVSDSELEALRRRLDEVRLPEAETVSGAPQSARTAGLKACHWTTSPN